MGALAGKINRLRQQQAFVCHDSLWLAYLEHLVQGTVRLKLTIVSVSHQLYIDVFFSAFCCGSTHMFCCTVRRHHMVSIVFLNQVTFFGQFRGCLWFKWGKCSLKNKNKKKKVEKAKKWSAFVRRLYPELLWFTWHEFTPHRIHISIEWIQDRGVPQSSDTHCYFTPSWYTTSSDTPVVPSPSALGPQSTHPSLHPSFCAFTSRTIHFIKNIRVLDFPGLFSPLFSPPLLSSSVLSSPPLFPLSLILPFPLFRWKAGIEPAVAFQNLRPRLQCVWLFNTAGSH